MTTNVQHAVYATFRQRLRAFVIDTLFELIALVVLLNMASNSSRGVIAWLALVAVHRIGGTYEGGTIGKRLCSLRVVRTDGTPISFMRALVRETIGEIANVAPIYLGYLWMMDDPHRQTFGDRIADTVVVREFAQVPAPAWSQSPPWQQQQQGSHAFVTTGAATPGSGVIESGTAHAQAMGGAHRIDAGAPPQDTPPSAD